VSRGWLLAGLRDVRQAMRENTELARRVAEHPSGFLPTDMVESDVVRHGPTPDATRAKLGAP
jgi:hypothetical protein